MCFSNSTEFVVRKRQGTYVEGYALSKKFPIMPIHHAWVTMDGNDAMDLTLNAEDYEYFGVTFDNDTLWAELRKLKRYGILDTGFGLNHELMFRLDPELEANLHARSETTTNGEKTMSDKTLLNKLGVDPEQVVENASGGARTPRCRVRGSCGKVIEPDAGLLQRQGFGKRPS